VNAFGFSADYPDSYYAASANPHPHHPKLEGQASADVCVVGGGFTGVSAALHLAERGYDVILLEAARVGWGASGRNGGQLGTGLRKDVIELEARLGRQRTRALWDMASEAMEIIRDRIERHGIR
jgi:gamma-glutamylputrescine oxidase